MRERKSNLRDALKCTVNHDFTARCKYVPCTPSNHSHWFGHFGLVTGRQECLTSDLYNLSAPSSLHIPANGPVNSPLRCQRLRSRSAPVNILHLHTNRRRKRRMTLAFALGFGIWTMCVSLFLCMCCSSKAQRLQAALMKLPLTHSLAAAAPKLFSSLSIHIWPSRGTTRSSGCILCCTRLKWLGVTHKCLNPVSASGTLVYRQAIIISWLYTPSGDLSDVRTSRFVPICLAGEAVVKRPLSCYWWYSTTMMLLTLMESESLDATNTNRKLVSRKLKEKLLKPWQLRLCRGHLNVSFTCPCLCMRIKCCKTNHKTAEASGVDGTQTGPLHVRYCRL